MFGVGKEQLVKGLARVSCRLCGYLGPRCDCKYMQNSDDFSQGSEQTGCPETAVAACLINAMTEEEFHQLAKRAGIEITEASKKIDIQQIMYNMKTQRDNALKSNEYFTATKKSKRDKK